MIKISFYKWLSTGVMNWDTGDIIDKTNFNGNWQAIAPIGSIVAWNKSETGTPSLSEGWVECNGQAITDSDSPYNGLNAPNLNGTTEATKRFLRGSLTSKTTGGADTETHQHNLHTADNTHKTSTDAARFDRTEDATINIIPPYFEVCWIMRIK